MFRKDGKPVKVVKFATDVTAARLVTAHDGMGKIGYPAAFDGGPPLPAGNAQQANGAVSALVKNEERPIGILNLGALFPGEAVLSS